MDMRLIVWPPTTPHAQVVMTGNQEPKSVDLTQEAINAGPEVGGGSMCMYAGGAGGKGSDHNVCRGTGMLAR
jgi:hypothetical protein